MERIFFKAIPQILEQYMPSCGEAVGMKLEINSDTVQCIHGNEALMVDVFDSHSTGIGDFEKV
jgi:hypothetical protein